MSLFQCENCGCCENTALSSQGFNGFFERLYDWDYAPVRKGMKLCSACGPIKYSDGHPTEYGHWHCVFPRVFLPKGMFKTASNGNLEHIGTGDQDYTKYALEVSHD
ncbi:TPA: hypothetical protein RKY22_005615 [Klebsiella michiganensis]|nr:hypothetical protein [Klebsiella michiganensis]HDW0214994.1 hypothetical protein [Klebsiella michiganensis]